MDPSRLAGAGMKVAVVERRLVGGTCVNTGCTPTKALVASAYAARIARRAAEYGVVIGGDIGIDMRRVKARRALWRRHETGLPGPRKRRQHHALPRARSVRVAASGGNRRRAAMRWTDTSSMSVAGRWCRRAEGAAILTNCPQMASLGAASLTGKRQNREAKMKGAHLRGAPFEYLGGLEPPTVRFSVR